MKHETKTKTRSRSSAAFTLIEMLMVIAIIGILAAITIAVYGLAGDQAKRKRVQAQLVQLETAIQSFHAKHGVYPTDGQFAPNLNGLYYELTGATWDGTVWYEGDDTNRADRVDESVFGLGGFINSAKRGQTVQNFLPGVVKTVEVAPNAKMLSVPVDWPANYPNPPIPGRPTLNVWRYNSSHPVHNKNSYDLWAEIVLRGKLIRISNWER